jgi:hypothetical protein
LAKKTEGLGGDTDKLYPKPTHEKNARLEGILKAYIRNQLETESTVIGEEDRNRPTRRIFNWRGYWQLYPNQLEGRMKEEPLVRMKE